MICIDYLIIECAGTGQITLGRSLLKLMGAVIDVGKGIMCFTAPPGSRYEFPKGKSKNRRGKNNFQVIILMLLHSRILDSCFLRLAKRS